MRLNFGQWAPDAEEFLTDQVSDLSCVLPGPNCYYPVPSPAALTAALPSKCLGAYAGLTSDGTYFCVAGTSTKLYKLNTSDMTWDDVSRVSGGDYSAADEQRWQFTLYEEDGDSYVIAVNKGDVPQKLKVGPTPVDSNFTAVPGSPYKAATVGVWGPHLVLGDLEGFPSAVQGSDIGDFSTWTPLSTNNAFFQEFAAGGRVCGFTDSDRPVIVQESIIRRGAIVGRPQKVAFDVMATNIGSRVPESVTSRDDRIFFHTDDGFYAASADTMKPIPIGLHKVNRWVLDNAVIGTGGLFVGQVDPIHARVYWALSFGRGLPLTTLLIYDWRLDRWSKCDVELDGIFRFRAPGTNLEELSDLYPDLDNDVPFSLDGRIWQAGAPILGAIFNDNKIGSFSGENKAASITTAEFTGGTAARWRLTGAYPIVDAVPGTTLEAVSERYPNLETVPVSLDSSFWDANVTVTPQRRNIRGEEWVSRSAAIRNSTGWHPLRSTGRLHRLRVDVAVGSNWAKIQGVDVEMQPEGRR